MLPPNGHFQIVKLFLADLRVNCDKGNSAVQSVCIKGHLDIFKLLIADPSLTQVMSAMIVLICQSKWAFEHCNDCFFLADIRVDQ
jgi:hypothetical protein